MGVEDFLNHESRESTRMEEKIETDRLDWPTEVSTPLESLWGR
jgi:hypothetical protein